MGKQYNYILVCIIDVNEFSDTCNHLITPNDDTTAAALVCLIKFVRLNEKLHLLNYSIPNRLLIRSTQRIAKPLA